MTLWQTVLIVLYMAGAWATFKGGLERMVDVEVDAVMNRPTHRVTKVLYSLFYANMARVIITSLLWPITMFIGIGIVLYFYRKNKRLRK